VRRLVTYEDYALRLLQDVGEPRRPGRTASWNHPQREYMLVTDSMLIAVEIGEAASTIGDRPGLLLIRTMWDAGSPTATSSRAT
jgi:hypothetical protein